MELNEYLAPYLPYDLKGIRPDDSKNKYIYQLQSIHRTLNNIWVPEDFGDATGLDCRPILRSMSELTRKELEDVGFDSHIDYLTYENQGVEWTLNAPYKMVVYLFKNHYDVFGLVDQGLAVNMYDVDLTK